MPKRTKKKQQQQTPQPAAVPAKGLGHQFLSYVSQQIAGMVKLWKKRRDIIANPQTMMYAPGPSDPTPLAFVIKLLLIPAFIGASVQTTLDATLLRGWKAPEKVTPRVLTPIEVEAQIYINKKQIAARSCAELPDLSKLRADKPRGQEEGSMPKLIELSDGIKAKCSRSPQSPQDVEDILRDYSQMRFRIHWMGFNALIDEMRELKPFVAISEQARARALEMKEQLDHYNDEMPSSQDLLLEAGTLDPTRFRTEEDEPPTPPQPLYVELLVKIGNSEWFRSLLPVVQLIFSASLFSWIAQRHGRLSKLPRPGDAYLYAVGAAMFVPTIITVISSVALEMIQRPLFPQVEDPRDFALQLIAGLSKDALDVPALVYVWLAGLAIQVLLLALYIAAIYRGAHLVAAILPNLSDRTSHPPLTKRIFAYMIVSWTLALVILLAVSLVVLLIANYPQIKS